MQRHKFKVEIQPEKEINKIPRTAERKVHTYSDCIEFSKYNSSVNKAIHCKNKNFDKMNNLI